jgi:fluoroquinolone resistance protein
VAERKRGPAAPPAVHTVTGADWYAKDLSGQEHSRVAFVDIDATECENRGAVFTECTFRRVRFNCSAHADSAFVNCVFVNCDFFEARFDDCKLMGSKFERCTHDLMQVRGGNWSHVALPGADLRRATFHGVRMCEADLTAARCEGASMRDVDLAGAWLHGATLARCDLRGSDLGGIEPQHVELAGAIVTFEQAVVIAAALGLDVRPD